MPVTDHHVATLRAQLVDDREEHRRLYRRIPEDEVRSSYLALVNAAFDEAVLRRFRGKSRADVIRWVADLREQIDTDRSINPDVAERLILEIFGKSSTDDLAFETELGHQIIILLALVRELQLANSDLDDFLRKARALADKALT